MFAIEHFNLANVSMIYSDFTSTVIFIDVSPVFVELLNNNVVTGVESFDKVF